MHKHIAEVMTQPRLHVRPSIHVQRRLATRANNIEYRGALLLGNQRANSGVVDSALQAEYLSRAQHIGATGHRGPIRQTEILRIK
jgi:hypothetical protein